MREISRKQFAKARLGKAAAVLFSLALSACLFDSSPKTAATGGGWDDFPNRLANTCGDITPEQLRAGEAAPALLGMRSALAGADKSLLTQTQQVGEAVLLPKVDSAIAALEKVMANPDFRFTLENQGKTYSLDRGEVGPILAGLKF